MPLAWAKKSPLDSHPGDFDGSMDTLELLGSSVAGGGTFLTGHGIGSFTGHR